MSLVVTPAQHSPAETSDRLARRALFGFVPTFILSRPPVLLVMADCIPNLFFFLHGTHVHHLNYGIFLLAAVGGYTLFARPDGRRAEAAALAYGFALALTFAPSLKRLETHHFWGFLVLLLTVIGFGVVVIAVGGYMGGLVGPTLHDLEAASSP